MNNIEEPKRKVEFGNEDINLTKVIKVYIDREIPEEDLLKCCFTASSFNKVIKSEAEEIITTQTHAINSSNYLNGYDIVLISKGYQIKFSDILSGKYNDYIREIRISHNWEKMFYSDLFNIPGIFEYEV